MGSWSGLHESPIVILRVLDCLSNVFVRVNRHFLAFACCLVSDSIIPLRASPAKSNGSTLRLSRRLFTQFQMDTIRGRTSGWTKVAVGRSFEMLMTNTATWSSSSDGGIPDTQLHRKKISTSCIAARTRSLDCPRNCGRVFTREGIAQRCLRRPSLCHATSRPHDTDGIRCCRTAKTRQTCPRHQH